MCAPPAANDLFFFHSAFFLEDVAVTAQRGVIGMLNSEEFTSVLAGILGAEAYAAGAIRWRLSDRLAVVTPWNQPVWQVINAFSAWRQKLSGRCVAIDAMRARARVHALNYVRVISSLTTLCPSCATPHRVPYRSRAVTDVGLLQPVAQSSIAQAPQPRTFAGGNALQITAVDPLNGLVFARTPQQVLAILYGSGDASKPGLFFPQGINGNIKGM
jgi:hypothetical protein